MSATHSCIVWLALGLPGVQQENDTADVWVRAQEHAVLSAAGADFCRGLLAGWDERGEAATGLLPESPTSPVWTPENSAADLYAWLVLAADWAGDEADRARMRRLLAVETAYSSRLGGLPDAVHLADLGFYHDELRPERLLVGASEYAKDGLLPLLEALGPSPWSDRLVQIAGGLAAWPGFDGEGRLPSGSAEVNGELLQVFARVWHFTGEERFAAPIQSIARAYRVDVAGATGALPCHRFDFERGVPIVDELYLHDHGNEILGGLVEAALVLRTTNMPACRKLQRYLDEVFARLAERAVLADGSLAARVSAATGEVVDASVTDTSAYVLLSFLAWSEVGEGDDYRPLVARALEALASDRYKGLGGDSLADTLESTVLLMNRIPSPAAEESVRRRLRVLLGMQRPNGLVQGAYGDGNAARSVRLAARWLQGGTRLEPPAPAVALGAVIDGDALHVSLQASGPYRGRFCFDHARHVAWLRLPWNIPRLNEDPVWFPVEGDAWYSVAIEGKRTRLVLGSELREGLPLDLRAGEDLRVRVERFDHVPPGGPRVRIEGPRVVRAGATAVELDVGHDLPFDVVLRCDPPHRAGSTVELPAGETRTLALDLPAAQPSAALGLSAHTVTLSDPLSMCLGRWTAYGSRTVDVLDVRFLRGDGVSGNLGWVEVGADGIELDLDLPADAPTEGRVLHVHHAHAGAPPPIRVSFSSGDGGEHVERAAVQLDGRAHVATCPLPDGAAAGEALRIRLLAADPARPVHVVAVLLTAGLE